MKEWKEKEVIIGLIIIIILGLIALFLIIRRDLKGAGEPSVTEPVVLEEAADETVEEALNDVEAEEIVTEEAEPEQSQETDEETASFSQVQMITEANSSKLTENESTIGLYDILGEEKYTPHTMTEMKKDDGQLKELFEYWDSYQLDAVDDLIRLERVRKLIEPLNGTDKFYYYGSVDRLGRPSGKGLAAYGDNTYYCGEWKEGLRHGKGMWLQVAIYDETNSKMNLGVIEHSYNGEWSKDLPNGKGQEHFSYDYNILNEEILDGKVTIANVIGNFKNGYYHGEMYIMTVDETGNTKDWAGVCNQGVWDAIQVGNTTDSVWKAFEAKDGKAVFYYMFPKDNKDWGVLGLKK